MVNHKLLLILLMMPYVILGNENLTPAFDLVINSREINLIHQELIDISDTSWNLVFLPVVFNGLEPVPEVDLPPCRWPYGGPGNPLWISYQWGDRLQTPGSLWRTAFETGLSAWNNTSANVTFYYYSSSANVINTYEDASNNRGITYITCMGDSTTRVDILGNIYWDIQDNYTANQRKGIATHETGHGISIGHIPNEYARTALMYKFGSLSFFESVNIPQAPDIELVNQVYP